MKTKTIAESLLALIKEGLYHLGIPDSVLNRLDNYIYILIIATVAWLSGQVAHRLASFSLQRIQRHRRVMLIDKLFEYNALRKLSYIVPPMIVLALLPFSFEDSPQLLHFLERATWIYLIVTLTVSLNVVLSSIGSAALTHGKFQNRPIKGFVQILQILFICIAVILIASIVVNRSPAYLITGLSAFAAILLLVFKDSILGLVGGILLEQNDMVRIGDWIEVPDGAVNGVVTDITLTIVKVQNFDNTTVTIPPYSLISGSFVNWRGMSDSGGRRIMMQVNLMYDYVKPCTPQFLDRMMGLDPELDHFIEEKRRQAAAGATVNTSNPAALPDGTIETNAGLLRAYLTLYIKRHPRVHRQMLSMVRVMPPTPQGLPMQIYCFTDTTVWVEYEGIVSEIMEHLIGVMPRFELFAAQSPGSRDVVLSGMACAMGRDGGNAPAAGVLFPYRTVGEKEPPQ